MPGITDLTDAQIQSLRAKFSEDAMDAALTAALPAVYPVAQGYVQAIASAFAQNLPEDLASGPRLRLSAADRERILIALLGAREERVNLAVHLYYAVGLGIRLQEILHILLLTGVYTGIPAFASAVEVVGDTFQILADVASQEPEPLQVLGLLRQKFDLPPPS
jgi:alkylhydroperoxidase/carboxymuconolactone decarboxylase family protein YurZ